jgi:dihydrofolate reductase
MWNNEVSEFMADYWKRFDTVVMGRRTYEVALRRCRWWCLSSEAVPRKAEEKINQQLAKKTAAGRKSEAGI